MQVTVLSVVGLGLVIAMACGSAPADGAPAAAAKPERTPPPPPPFIYVGRMVVNGVPTALLTSSQGQNLEVREGTLLPGGYRVESIDERGITLKQLPLGPRQIVGFAAASPTADAGVARPPPPEKVEETH